jgi:hypothetical protein
LAVAADLDRVTNSEWDWVAEQPRTYVPSGGTDGQTKRTEGALVVATTGRITGLPRRTCLIFGTSEADFILVAFKGGPHEDPDWFKSFLSVAI